MTISPGASVTAAVSVGAAVGASVSPPAAVDVGVAVETYRDRDPYTGEYTATPSRHEQVYETAGKTMRDDFTVVEIPYYTTTNISGGYTAIISEE